MRTTITFDDDTAAVIEHLRHERGTGVSEVVNDLVRRAVAIPVPRRAFRQRSAALGALVDLRNVAEVTDLVEAPARR